MAEIDIQMLSCLCVLSKLDIIYTYLCSFVLSFEYMAQKWDFINSIISYIKIIPKWKTKEIFGHYFAVNIKSIWTKHLK